MDQHELEQARVEQRRLEAAQRDLLDRLSAGVARFGSDRALRFWNQPFMSLFGLDQERLADNPPFERRSEEHTSELQSLMRISYAVFCLKKKTTKRQKRQNNPQ